MSYGSCAYCGRSLILSREGARFCSPKCRVYWHRKNGKLPAEMTDRQAWVRAQGKRPITVFGTAASSTNSATWSTYKDVTAASVGDGLGIMLGAGLGCYDIDHCVSENGLTSQARHFVASITEPIVWVERSVSGTGIHVFVSAPEGPGWKRGGVERYTRERFIRVTGDQLTI